jgi:hypothetical protein
MSQQATETALPYIPFPVTVKDSVGTYLQSRFRTRVQPALSGVVQSLFRTGLTPSPARCPKFSRLLFPIIALTYVFVY